MLSILRSSQSGRRSRRVPSHRRIRFESLERRYCLSAPTITAFQIDSVDGNTVTLSGCVSDENPGTVEVDFSGPLSGSTTPNASGNFSYEGDAWWLGEIVAVATDDEQLESAPASVQLTSDAPGFESVEVVYHEHTSITIMGWVVDEDPCGLQVDFSGVVEGCAFTDVAGYFELYVSEASLGPVNLTVFDTWWLMGETSVEITGDNPPEIEDFSANVGPTGILTVMGTVVDEDPAGLTVIINWRMDYYVETDSNGDFFWQKELDPYEEGWVHCTAMDWWGLASGTVSDYVMYIPSGGHSE